MLLVSESMSYYNSSVIIFFITGVRPSQYCLCVGQVNIVSYYSLDRVLVEKKEEETFLKHRHFSTNYPCIQPELLLLRTPHKETHYAVERYLLLMVNKIVSIVSTCFRIK